MDFQNNNVPATMPWLVNIRGTQVLPIINLDDDTIRVEAGPGTGKTFGLVSSWCKRQGRQTTAWFS